MAVEYDEPRGARLVDFLFRHAPQEPRLEPEVIYRLRWFETSGRLGLYRDGQLIYLGEAEGVLAEILQGEVCRHLAKRGRGGLVFHAACVSAGEQALILPGESAAGKSTLAAWLTTQGYGYLSDELVYIPCGSLEIQPFTRPLSLKRPSQVVLAPYLDWATLQPHLLPSADGWLLAPEALGAVAQRPSWPLRAIIVPCYQSKGTYTWQRLSEGLAAMRLLSSLVNSAQLWGRGFSELTRLCRQAPVIQTSYASFAQIEEKGRQDWRSLQEFRETS